MRLKDGLAAIHGGAPRGSKWNWFPRAIIGGMALAVIANAAMVFCALHTFPGQAGGDGFDVSNSYNRVLDVAQRQAVLGWNVRVGADSAGRAVVALTDRTGNPLLGARVQAIAERPLGAPQTTQLQFHEASAGRYVANAALNTPGQWELAVTAEADGRDLVATRRLVISPGAQQPDRLARGPG